MFALIIGPATKKNFRLLKGTGLDFQDLIVIVVLQ